MTAAKIGERISDNLARLEVQLGNFQVMLNKIDEIINGTSKTGGLKERMAIVEEDVKRNKESFLKIERNINELRAEMLQEIGQIAKDVKNSRPPGINWGGVLDTVIKAIAVGVTGILFWQIIRVLAANAPP